MRGPLQPLSRNSLHQIARSHVPENAIAIASVLGSVLGGSMGISVLVCWSTAVSTGSPKRRSWWHDKFHDTSGLLGHAASAEAGNQGGAQGRTRRCAHWIHPRRIADR